MPAENALGTTGQQFLNVRGTHPTTFEYLKPTDEQMRGMDLARKAAKDYADTMSTLLPDGPDKTYLLRKFREVAMWANIAITRQPDGAPRT